MGVTVREKQAGSGEYWVFVYNNGQQTSRKIGEISAEGRSQVPKAKHPGAWSDYPRKFQQY